MIVCVCVCVCEEALGELGLELTDLCEQEPDMALGNGGLGRLAACFIDSLATLNYPAVGYGIHYEHGLFRQEIQDGRQIERPDSWREYGNPWEICRPESVQEIPLYGYVETVFGDKGGLKKVWHAGRKIKGVPWDIPVVGFGGHTVNILRLWESRGRARKRPGGRCRENVRGARSGQETARTSRTHP